MKTVPDIIARFGGPSDFARVINKRPSTASEMKRNRSIPVDYWPTIIAAAAERGIEGVTAEFLMKIHTVRGSSVPSSEPVPFPTEAAE